MTEFFVAGLATGDQHAEEAYRELREHSQNVVGSPARARRIFKLSCRLDGCDREIEVGRPLPPGSDVVAAIIDHGREDAFVVHTAAEGASGAVRVGGPVYSVTEFS
jgi:hypothetical protein